MTTGAFITGTDTGVGKTFVAVRLIRALRAAGGDAVGFKPIVCGERTDAFQLANASGGLALDEVNPLWLKPPVAPFTASIIDDRPIDPDAIHRAYATLRSRHACVIVEGAGGWLVPVTRELTMADFAVAFALPVWCVVANRLGCLSHALLTREAILARSLPFAGFVLNSGVVSAPANPLEAALADLATNTNGAVLEEISGERIIAIGPDAPLEDFVTLCS